jgi:pimeloyl-ACP methyl ester carboxylesterase
MARTCWTKDNEVLMSQPTPTEMPNKADGDLHVLGRLSKKFPEKAAKRALWAFSTPPRLPAPEMLAGLAPHKSFSRDGLRLLTWGQNLHKKALLVHGWGLQGASMQSFVPALLARDFQVMAFDGPAHGESPGGRVTGADFARAILSLTEEFGTFEAIVGHSVGGAAASLAMGKGASIKRAALLAPAYLPEIIDNFAQMVDLTAEVKAIFIELLAVDARWPLDDWRNYNLAPAVSQPVVVFHDPEDRQVSIVHSRKYVDLAQMAVLHEIPLAGHNSILGHPQVVESIVQFVDQA